MFGLCWRFVRWLTVAIDCHPAARLSFDRAERYADFASSIVTKLLIKIVFFETVIRACHLFIAFTHDIPRCPDVFRLVGFLVKVQILFSP